MKELVCVGEFVFLGVLWVCGWVCGWVGFVVGLVDFGSIIDFCLL